MIVAVTGPRPHKIGLVDPATLQRFLGGRLAHEIERLKPSMLFTGMALGIDQACAWICLHRRIPFTAVLPCLDQEKKWTVEQQERYHELLGRSSDKRYVSAWPYQDGCMDRRNEWMVDNSDVLLAVIWPGYKGGTANCVRYAEKVGRKIVRIDPRVLGVRSVND